MASTSVHLPEALVRELDRLAADRGTSRNRLIVEACRRLVRDTAEWPPDLFSNDHLDAEDLAELAASAEPFTTSILAARRSRSPDPLGWDGRGSSSTPPPSPA